MSEENKIYDQVIPDIEKWPIYRLSEDRKAFVEELDAFTMQKLELLYGPGISDLILKTIYLERIRIKEEPWKVDPPNDRLFWRRIQKRMVKYGIDREPKQAEKVFGDILHKIIHRYSEEIVGTFRIQTFLFARGFLTLFFTRLLNTAVLRTPRGLFGGKYRLRDRLKVLGETDAIRSLIKKGTVVVVPTHFSNLDSILIGYAMDMFLGLPSFSYGAGLNLYNTGYTAYFMNRLGAYRVDRRKKNPIYLETLKSMSKLSIERGVNSLFFPGGTRSRAGSIETRLKLGLLGTAVEAQRSLLQKGKKEKIFVVPLILSYHFVLEAPFLIEQHLRTIGKERYILSKDNFQSLWQIIKFTWRVFSSGNEIVLSFAKPMDVLGNPVDMEGNSFDQYGNPIDIRDYFLRAGELRMDLQRESEYTKILADKIVERFHCENIVLTSHLVAFAAFRILKHENRHLDLYGILRLPADDFVFPWDYMIDVVGQLRSILLEMEKQREIKLSQSLRGELEELIRDGIKRMGNFHLKNPLRIDKKGRIVSDSFKLLYYYHNRLKNYDLENKIQWKKFELEEIEEVEEA
jgi:glycerol-3-phosphate O-acyltransferase